MRDVSFDIVIPTLGRPSLGRLLEALAASGGPFPDALFLVDDRKGARHPLALPALPGEWADRIIVLRGKSAGPACARNTGWRASSAEWIAFLDDDVLPEPDWLEQLNLDLLGPGPETAASQGRVLVPLPRDRRATDWERNVAGLETALWITADMAYRRQALEAVGGFDERFPRAYREDSDLAIRVQQAGFRLVRGSRRVVHPVGRSAFWTSVKLQAGNADDAMMRKMHGSEWRSHAKAAPSRLPLYAASSLALAAGSLGQPSLRYRALAAWGLLSAAFAWSRISPGPKTPDEISRMVLTSILLPPAALFHRLRGELTARRRKLPPGPTRQGREAGVRAVLFDRDGTLIEDVPYNGDPEKVVLKPGAQQAVRRLREAGISTAVVSNQSGVARGLLTTTQVDSVNDRIEQMLGPLGPWVICAHGPEEGCGCRKPAPGMIIEAARRLGVETGECVVIGDIGADVEAAREAGASAILIPGPITLPEEIAAAPVVTRGLAQAIDLVLARAGRRGTA